MPREIVFNEDEVLNNAVNLFWRKGFSGTSMQDITAVTGLNRSSIYNSFDSKIELYKRALKTYSNTIEGLHQRALLKSSDSKEALVLFFEYLIEDIIEDTDNKGCFIVNSTLEMSQRDTTIKKWLTQSQENEIRFLEELLRDAQQKKLINTNDSAINYAVYLYNTAQGLRVTGVLYKNRIGLKTISENTFKIFD